MMVFERNSFNPSPQKTEAGKSQGVRGQCVLQPGSKTSRTVTQRNPISKPLPTPEKEKETVFIHHEYEAETSDR